MKGDNIPAGCADFDPVPADEAGAMRRRRWRRCIA